jgi:pilus assembly protein CpaB
MRVDVLITGLPPGGNALDGPKVRTLLQNIQVLSAGTNFKNDQEGKPEPAQVVNLLVTPAQAEILSLASNETRIQLVLRNPMDTQVSGLPGTIVSELYGGARAPLAAPSPHPKSPPRFMAPTPPVIAATAAPSGYIIEVLNGSKHTQARFSLPAEKQ